jgi:hypothetical protein
MHLVRHDATLIQTANFSCAESNAFGMKCGFCEKITKYKCVHCELPACNRCRRSKKTKELLEGKQGNQLDIATTVN